MTNIFFFRDGWLAQANQIVCDLSMIRIAQKIPNSLLVFIPQGCDPHEITNVVFYAMKSYEIRF